MWIVLTIVYALLIGVFNVFRKSSAQKSPILFVIALSCTVGFLSICWSAPEAFATDGKGVGLFFLKTFFIFVAWILELIAFRLFYVSSLQPINSIRSVIGFAAGILVFGEAVLWWRFVGVAVVFAGLIILNVIDKKFAKENALIAPDKTFEQQAVSRKNAALAVCLFVISCVIQEILSIFDRIFMQNYLPSQMQFWFMLFISALAWVGFLLQCWKSKKWLVQKSNFADWKIYLCGIILALADRSLFTAIAADDVLMSVVAILKQLSIVVAVVLGGIMFKEPALKQKLAVLALILCGISLFLF